MSYRLRLLSLQPMLRPFLYEVNCRRRNSEKTTHSVATGCFAENDLIFTCTTCQVLVENWWNPSGFQNPLTSPKSWCFQHSIIGAQLTFIIWKGCKWLAPPGQSLLFIPVNCMGCRQRLKPSWSLKPFLENEVRPFLVCRPVFHNKHMLIKC